MIFRDQHMRPAGVAAASFEDPCAPASVSLVPIGTRHRPFPKLLERQHSGQLRTAYDRFSLNTQGWVGLAWRRSKCLSRKSRTSVKHIAPLNKTTSQPTPTPFSYENFVRVLLLIYKYLRRLNEFPKTVCAIAGSLVHSRPGLRIQFYEGDAGLFVTRLLCVCGIFPKNAAYTGVLVLRD